MTKEREKKIIYHIDNDDYSDDEDDDIEDDDDGEAYDNEYYGGNDGFGDDRWNDDDQSMSSPTKQRRWISQNLLEQTSQHTGT